ncbi:MAG: hypothetical protein JNK53_00870, partial [Phycisphaerae bacterium]|nr:hypothetical protein [Phycisphaerae bacterium]
MTLRNALSIMAASVLAPVAAADFVDVALTSTGAGHGVSVTLNSVGYSTFAGQLNLALSASTGVNLNGSWVAYCTELNQHITIGGASQTYTVMDVADLPIPGFGMGVVRADAIARMYAAAGGAQYVAN